jgi:hypothetical protein
MVRTNIFLRLLNYRVNLADEISANIQRLASRSSAVGRIDRSISASPKKQRQLSTNKHNNDDKQPKHSAPPPLTPLDDPATEITIDSDVKHINDEDENSNSILTRELSTKFRALVHQHRKMIKQLNETDEFVPFLDRKVNRFMIQFF